MHMSVWCSGKGGFARGRGHGFEPRQPRSVAACDGGDGWVAGRWGLSYKKVIFLFFRFLSADPENLSAGG
jgi:hypothetical protein